MMMIDWYLCRIQDYRIYTRPLLHLGFVWEFGVLVVARRWQIWIWDKEMGQVATKGLHGPIWTFSHI